MARSLFLSGDRPLLNAALFAATLVTTYLVGLQLGSDGREAVAYSAAVVAILGTHEMGHYVFARRHGVDTTLPYFIPLPLGFGTLGAVIRIRSRIPTKNALVDIGAAGPLAGLAVAIPVLIWGLTLSRVGDAPPMSDAFAGDWSLYGVVRYLLDRGVEADTPSAEGPLRLYFVYGDSLLMQALTWLVFGPLPPGKEVFVHPMVTAGWFGLLVTMLNLCPIGQLDGGHLSFAWLGARAPLIGKIAALGLLFLAVFFSATWLVWLAVTSKVIGFQHPEVAHPEEPLSSGRRMVVLVSLAALALCVVPIPIQQVMAP